MVKLSREKKEDMRCMGNLKGSFSSQLHLRPYETKLLAVSPNSYP
jgi:hypothetical protein